MIVRTGEHHGFSDEDATNPDNQFSFRVSPAPMRDHALAALLAAQDKYFQQWPEARKYASALLWSIEKDDPSPTVTVQPNIAPRTGMSEEAVAEAVARAVRGRS